MLVFPLRLRRWQNGDVFYPFGGPGKKKISKYFKDERLSLVRKNKIWLLECENRIMWVVGLRADERFRVTDQCREITKITWLEGD
jgi:tRNA(Ile)-lysidine synthase